jgi:hypothetical protein
MHPSRSPPLAGPDGTRAIGGEVGSSKISGKKIKRGGDLLKQEGLLHERSLANKKSSGQEEAPPHLVG